MIKEEWKPFVKQSGICTCECHNGNQLPNGWVPCQCCKHPEAPYFLQGDVNIEEWLRNDIIDTLKKSKLPPDEQKSLLKKQMKSSKHDVEKKLIKQLIKELF